MNILSRIFSPIHTPRLSPPNESVDVSEYDSETQPCRGCMIANFTIRPICICSGNETRTRTTTLRGWSTKPVIKIPPFIFEGVAGIEPTCLVLQTSA